MSLHSPGAQLLPPSLRRRAELAKSLAAYTKNHFPNGLSSVSSSQIPLLPPAQEVAVSEQPQQPVQGEDPASVVEPVTDVVSEQVASGENEPAPTPAVGDSPKEEVEQPGGLEKLDHQVEEAKEEEEKAEEAETASVPEAGNEEPAEEPASIKADPLADTQAVDGKAVEEAVVEPETKNEGEVAAQEAIPQRSEQAEDPKVEEGETNVPELPAAATSTTEPRKQERIENPTYTLEVVGNRYNPSNFW